MDHYTISKENKYAHISTYNKFGVWPEKKHHTPYYTSSVGTWFTVWWTEPGTPHYEAHWFGENRLKPADYGYYSSGDEDYLTHVFARMKYIGIDFLLLDDTNGHWNDTGYIARNMERCYQVADSMKGYAPQIAVATGDPLRNGDLALQQKEFDVYYEYVTKFPEIYYQYRGKPLLLMYAAGEAGRRYEDNQGRFTHRYGTGYISWQDYTEDQTVYKTQGNWGWVFDRQNEGTEIMGVQPGYNKPYHRPVPREGGKHYIELWLKAIKANPEVIVIPSYNDHCEETGWEATLPLRPPVEGSAEDTPGEDPYLYEKITEAYLALRYGYIEGFFYQVENSPVIYRCVAGTLVEVDRSLVGNEPVIMLPEGYREWEQNAE